MHLFSQWYSTLEKTNKKEQKIIPQHHLNLENDSVDNREPETQQNARPFQSSMAERQRVGYLETWPSSCKQTLLFGFSIPVVNVLEYHYNLPGFCCKTIKAQKTEKTSDPMIY